MVDKLSARVDRHDAAIEALIKSIRAFEAADVPTPMVATVHCRGYGSLP
jgi:hypothetical protein